MTRAPSKWLMAVTDRTLRSVLCAIVILGVRPAEAAGTLLQDPAHQPSASIVLAADLEGRPSSATPPRNWSLRCISPPSSVLTLDITGWAISTSRSAVATTTADHQCRSAWGACGDAVPRHDRNERDCRHQS